QLKATNCDLKFSFSLSLSLNKIFNNILSAIGREKQLKRSLDYARDNKPIEFTLSELCESNGLEMT
ncbi:MAG: hypothetical protein PHF25_08100, partial [Candidatus Margulisbacteria bacterium]|nr:hypothetical protein [Candidatus Margulisiibacteriota bacterium]